MYLCVIVTMHISTPMLMDITILYTFPTTPVIPGWDSYVRALHPHAAAPVAVSHRNTPMHWISRHPGCEASSRHNRAESQAEKTGNVDIWV